MQGIGAHTWVRPYWSDVKGAHVGAPLPVRRDGPTRKETLLEGTDSGGRCQAISYPGRSLFRRFNHVQAAGLVALDAILNHRQGDRLDELRHRPTIGNVPLGMPHCSPRVGLYDVRRDNGQFHQRLRHRSSPALSDARCQAACRSFMFCEEAQTMTKVVMREPLRSLPFKHDI